VSNTAVILMASSKPQPLAQLLNGFIDRKDRRIAWPSHLRLYMIVLLVVRVGKRLQKFLVTPDE
jgi:hypothetical protein